MVIGAFPVFKLGALFMKTLSKPLANFVKRRAKNNYIFRTYFCMPPAQCEYNLYIPYELLTCKGQSRQTVIGMIHYVHICMHNIQYHCMHTVLYKYIQYIQYDIYAYVWYG